MSTIPYEGGSLMAEVLEQLAKELFAGNAKGVAELTNKALAEGLKPSEVLNSGLIKGMSEVGVKFKANEIYVPEVLIAARAMKAGMEILKPKLAESGVEPVAKMIIGTVKGDLHDIGASLLKFAESEALKNKCVNIVLDVEAENQGAIKLYQKNGYVMVRTSPSLQLGKSQFQFIRMKKYLMR
jgi:5-methyltetrahydrofolate--homocysteine methyltransferase